MGDFSTQVNLCEVIQNLIANEKINLLATTWTGKGLKSCAEKLTHS